MFRLFMASVFCAALFGCSSIDEIAAVHKAQIGGIIAGKVGQLQGAVAANSQRTIAEESSKRYEFIERSYRADLEAAHAAGVLDPDTAIALARKRQSYIEASQAEIQALIDSHASLQEGFEVIRVGIAEMNALDLHAVAEKQRLVRGVLSAGFDAGIGIAESVIAHKAEEARREAQEKLEREAEKQEEPIGGEPSGERRISHIGPDGQPVYID